MDSSSLDRIRSIRQELDLLVRHLAGGGADPAPLAMAGTHDRIALEELAAGLLWQRSIIAEHFDAIHIVDPASNLLLFLYAAGPGASPSSGACCDAARVPRTTALRWIRILEDKGLIRALTDPADKRKNSVALTEAGRATMERCLIAIADAPVGGLSVL